MTEYFPKAKPDIQWSHRLAAGGGVTEITRLKEENRRLKIEQARLKAELSAMYYDASWS